MRWLLIPLLMATALGVRAEDDADGPRVHVYLATDRYNPRKGRADSQRIGFSNLTLDEVGKAISRSRSVLPDYGPDNPVTIAVYLSRQRPPAEQIAIVNELREQFRRGYRFAEPKIEIHYLEEEKVDPKVLSRRMEQGIDALARQLPGDQESRAALEELREANRKVLAETLDAMQAKDGILRRPSRVRRIVQAIAGARALFTFGSRATMAAAAGYQGIVPLLAGAGMIGAGPANDYFTTRYETEVDRILNNHPLLPKALQVGPLKTLNDLYQHSEGAKLVKGSIGVALIWGMADPAFMQTLAHINNPGYIPAVSGSDVLTFGLTSIPSAFFANGGFIGMEKLRHQGHLSEPALDLTLRGVGVLWQVAEVLLATGRPEFQQLVPFVLAPIWASMGAAIVAPYFLSPRNDRIVVVDSALRDTGAITRLEVLDSVRNIPPEKRRAMREIARLEKLEKIRKPVMRRALEKGLGLCGKALAALVPKVPATTDPRWFGN